MLWAGVGVESWLNFGIEKVTIVGRSPTNVRFGWVSVLVAVLFHCKIFASQSDCCVRLIEH